MAYTVEWAPHADRALGKLPHGVQRRVLLAVAGLAEDPLPPGAKRLEGGDLHSLRVGDYRVIYLVSGTRLLILVVDVGHRKSIYKGL